MPLQLVKNLQDSFLPVVKSLKCEETTKAYILSIFSAPQKIPNFTNESITIIYSEAKTRQKFDLFQNLGDHLLFIESVFPEHLQAASEEYYYVIGQMCYLSCFNITRKKMPLYEELADKFIEIINKLRHSGLSCPDK